MNWSLVILGLIGLLGATSTLGCFHAHVPNVIVIDRNNKLTADIDCDVNTPVNLKIQLVASSCNAMFTSSCNPCKTCNSNIRLPPTCQSGPGKMIITGTCKSGCTVTKNVQLVRNLDFLLVQTSSSTYRPGDNMEIRVIAADENSMPLDDKTVDIEVYDAAMKLVGVFSKESIDSGMTRTIDYRIDQHPNLGNWLVTTTLDNVTSSVQVLVTKPVIPSFDLKGIFQRFLLRTDKHLHGAIEMHNDENMPIFGRATIAIGQITEQDLSLKMDNQFKDDEWRQWKSQQMEIAGRVELNYDLQSMFNIDLNKALAIQIYIQATDLASGQDRVIRHIIPIFNREVIYDIRPLQFEAGTENEYKVIAKRLDGKPMKMEDMIVTVRMIIENEKEEKVKEIKDFYTRGRNDVGFFNLEIPENCIGVLMTITPLDESGKVRGYRTRSIPLMPTPRSLGAKLSIDLLPSTVAPAHTDVNVPVVSSQISTVGRTSNFYIQVLPSKSVTKFERLPMSYILKTNGRIILTGEFYLEPTKECQSKSVRTIRPEEPLPPTCMFNGTLPIEITREMVPYSILTVYTFQKPTFGFDVAESYRFSVAGLFQNPLTLNATIVPYKPMEIVIEPPHFLKEMNLKPIKFSEKVQEKTRVELSFTGAPDSIVGINVFEADGLLRGLPNQITRERLLRFLTKYEQIPLDNIPMMNMEKDKRQSKDEGGDYKKRTMSEEDEEQQIRREQMGYEVRHPLEEFVFGINSQKQLPSVEGDDIYTTSNLERLYGDIKPPSPLSPSHYHRKFQNTLNQYDITADKNDFVIATSMPLIFAANPPSNSMPMKSIPNTDEQMNEEYGTVAWYEKMNKKMKLFSQESMTFMQADSIRCSVDPLSETPKEMRTEDLEKIFSKYSQSPFNLREKTRQYLEEYISESDLSMMVPPIMLEEQSRTGYFRSIFFNTSTISSQGTGKILLPRMKPFSTWMASAFALNKKSGSAVAQPIRLPTDQGLYLLANFPRQIQTGEHVLLSYAISNYLKKDLSNVIVRIRPSKDFDLMEQNKPEQIVSNTDKDYTMTIPSMKSMAVETRHMIVVPKRAGLLQIVMEVESEFGGDYEIVTVFVRESDIQRREYTTPLFDLTSDKKTYGPFVTDIEQSPALRSVRVAVSGTGLDRFVKRMSMETNSLIGIDRTLVRLYRALGLRRYLNETFQTNSPLYNMTFDNITTAYQRLQLYQDYDSSYSFVSDEGTKYSSLYLTSFAFGAMISPMMPFRDNVTLNRTLNWILSHQQEDGSFDDQGPCYHKRFCSGKFRRESLTAIVLYCLTHDNVTDYMPEYLHEQLFKGENSPIIRAQKYLISRVPDVLPDLMTISLFEMAFIQNRALPSELHQKIYQALIKRKLTTVPEDGSRYIKVDETMSFDDQLLLNVMTSSLYVFYKDYQTTMDMARWIVKQKEVHPQHDTLLDAVFHTNVKLNFIRLIRKKFINEKSVVTIDVSADNGEKYSFQIDSTNLDLTQKFMFTLPVNKITYSVRGSGSIAYFRIVRTYAEPKQQIKDQSLPFQLTHEFMPMPWFSEVKCKTCMTYTPIKSLPPTEKVNHTMVIEFEIPSGTRVNVRQIGFYLSRIEQVMYFSYEPCGNKLIFFLNVPSSMFGKQICLEWMLERLSTVVIWSPIQIRVYDYLEPEIQLIERYPVQFQPNLLGYSFVDAVEKARPNLPSFVDSIKPKQV